MNKILLDIDGCITDGKGKAVDLTALQSLKTHIHQLNDTKNITTGLCTGRSALYVEAVAQMLDIQSWCICENGVYLYHTVTEEVIFHPNVTLDSRKHLQDIKQILTTDSKFTDICKIELGKEICISLNPIGDMAIKELFESVKSNLDLTDLYIAHSTTAVDITPQNINKGSALQMLCEIENLTLDKVLGVGDTMGDMSFLEICGQVACPNNAIDDIKSISSFVSDAKSTQGLVEIYQNLCHKVTY